MPTWPDQLQKASRTKLEEAMGRPAKKRYTEEEKRGIQGLKEALSSEAHSSLSMAHEKELLQLAKKELEGAPQDIARKALRYNNISEKQAYWIACELVEAGLVDHLE